MERLLLAVAMLGLVGVPARALQPDADAELFELPIRAAIPIAMPSEMRAARAVTEGMASRYGGSWHVYFWDPASDTPGAVCGSGIQLAARPLTSDSAAVDLAASFVADNPDLLGLVADDLVVERVARGAGKVVVHFTQRFHGLPVHGGRVMAAFTDGGRLFAFGSSFYRGLDLDPRPTLSAAAAVAASSAALPFDPASDKLLSEPELLVLPVPQAGSGAEARLVWRARLSTAEPPGAWATYVDAHDGRLLWRTNEVRYLYSGVVDGIVDQTAYCDGAATVPLRDMYVIVSRWGLATTGPDGEFSFERSGGDQSVTAGLDGPYVEVSDAESGSSSFQGTIRNDVPLAIHWTDATPSSQGERNVFYWVNETRAFIRGIQGRLVIEKHAAEVNAGGSCNASWSWYRMSFGREGSGCASTALLADAIAHEYGHGIQITLGYLGREGLGEGNADITATFMTDDPVIARGIYLDDCTRGLRNCSNTLRYPEDVVNQPIHAAGRVICGFNWDTRRALEQRLGPAAGKHRAGFLWHFGRTLYRPRTQLAQVLSYFLADDDDGNLTNGTPNYAEICAGAADHGFPCPEVLTGVQITHVPVRSTTDHSASLTVSARIGSIEGTIEVARVFYRTGDGPFIPVEMRAEPLAETYTGVIPAQQSDTEIEYYIIAEDDLGNLETSPGGAPERAHSFFVATVADLFEVSGAPPWTVLPGGATAGLWERTDPEGTAAQPEDDHTPDGVACFVTGGAGGRSVGENDVDGGATILVSPTWDLSFATEAAVARYWRWYSNNLGAAPNRDPWVVEASNDGGASWVEIENVNPVDSEQNTWVEVTVDLIALFGTPDRVAFRFLVSDPGPQGSVVEAALDDFVILTRADSPSAAPAPTHLLVGANHPNPFTSTTRISYTLEQPAEVTVTVFDSSGRKVRTLVREIAAAGPHAVDWDGRSELGLRLPSGVYFYRVEADRRQATRRMLLLR